MTFNHCKGVDWYAELRRCGATDCFAQTRYAGTANNNGFTKRPGPMAGVETLWLRAAPVRLVYQPQQRGYAT